MCGGVTAPRDKIQNPLDYKSCVCSGISLVYVFTISWRGNVTNPEFSGSKFVVFGFELQNWMVVTAIGVSLYGFCRWLMTRDRNLG
jgi:hypothetical protein